MRTRIISLIVIAMTTLSMNVQAQDSSSDKKVLVAYFSRSGNTRAVADHIKSLTGGDMFEIQVAKPYPEEYHACTEVAKKEKEDNARPTLKTKVENMASYDFNGKVVIPFCTHGGGGEQNCFKDFVKHIGKADSKQGFLIGGGQASSALPQVESWLKGLKLIQ